MSDACHALWNGDGSQAGAAIESRVSDACHALWHGDGSQAGAIFESPVSYARHAVSISVVDDRAWNDHIPAVFILIRRI